MKKMIRAALIIVSAVIAIILLFISFDAICLGSASATCRVWRQFQWESVVAGALGLAGGIFVIVSTRQQIVANRDDMVSAQMSEVTEFYHRICDNVADARRFFEEYNNAEENDHRGRVIRENWNKVRSNFNHDALFDSIQNQPTYPPQLKRACSDARNCIVRIRNIGMPNTERVQDNVREIGRRLDELHPEFTEKLKSELSTYRKRLYLRIADNT